MIAKVASNERAALVSTAARSGERDAEKKKRILRQDKLKVKMAFSTYTFPSLARINLMPFLKTQCIQRITDHCFAH